MLLKGRPERISGSGNIRNVTYIGDFLSFSLNRIAQVLFDHSHRGNVVDAERLNHL